MPEESASPQPEQPRNTNDEAPDPGAWIFHAGAAASLRATRVAHERSNTTNSSTHGNSDSYQSGRSFRRTDFRFVRNQPSPRTGRKRTRNSANGSVPER